MVDAAICAGLEPSKVALNLSQFGQLTRPLQKGGFQKVFAPIPLSLMLSPPGVDADTPRQHRKLGRQLTSRRLVNTDRARFNESSSGPVSLVVHDSIRSAGATPPADQVCRSCIPRSKRDPAMIRRFSRHLSTALLVALGGLTTAGLPAVSAADDDPAIASLLKLPLVFEEDFESGKASRWEPTDPSAWKIEPIDGNHVYSQFNRKSQFTPPVRSPFNRALVRDLKVSSFVLDADVQSTIPDYNHRDVCMFFGYQDDSHLYYVHFGKQTDDHANQIFIVNDKPRTKISTRTTPGTNWDDQWHHVRVARDAASGLIRIYFDNMSEPIMEATDRTFGAGRVGVGSFDDTGRWDNIKVRGRIAD